MTSNIGTRYARKGGTIGFQRPDEDVNGQEKELRRDIREELKKTFRPEFLNRIDEVIIFHNLTPEHMLDIVDLQMKEITARLKEQKVDITLTEAAREWLANKGYDPDFGARPLRRTLQRYIENPLSLQLLSGQVEHGALVADIEEDTIVFRPQPDTEDAQEENTEPVEAIPVNAERA
jgi:ATP-dependent Clp protease ATP-binding subunit ClpC